MSAGITFKAATGTIHAVVQVATADNGWTKILACGARGLNGWQQEEGMVTCRTCIRRQGGNPGPTAAQLRLRAQLTADEAGRGQDAEIRARVDVPRRSVAERMADRSTAERVATALVIGLEHNGGASIGAEGGNVPAAGFAVATGRADLAAVHQPTAYGVRHADVLGWVRTVRPFVRSTPGAVYGAWIGDDGMVYLDVSEVVADLATAVRLGTERDQRAIYSLELGADVPTYGTGALQLA